MSDDGNVTAMRERIIASQESSSLSFHWESPQELKVNWQGYTEARARCEWEKTHSSPIVDHDGSQSEYNEHLLRYVPFPFCDPICKYGRPIAESNRCTVAADGENADMRWRIQRIGPTTSHGGNDFIIIRSEDGLDMRDVLDAHGNVWIATIFLAAVDAASGRILPYPPIHMHHSHLGPHSMVGILDFVAPLHFPHGETSCQQEAGGDACYMFSFPSGHAFEMSEVFILNAMMNDVRAAGSPPLDVTLELAVRYTTTRVTSNVGLWYVGADSDTNAFAMLLLRKQTFYTFTVPHDDESVLWSTFKSVRSGTLLNIWHHTHVTEGFEEMWLIDATPPMLGLEEAGGGLYTLPGCNSPFVPSTHGLRSDDVRARILGRMKERRLGFRCVWRAPNTLRVRQDEGYPGVEPGLYGRQTEVQCFLGSDRVHAGKYITFVSYFNTRKLCEHCDGGEGIPFYQGRGVQQHMHFQGYIRHDDGSSALEYLFANRYDSYEWTTYPVREETLYCAFASKFAAPAVCPWELPGCAQPRYPAAPSTSAAALAFGAWGKLVQLSYFHWWTVFTIGLFINLAMLTLFVRQCCCRSRRGAPAKEIML